ncbi:hypothetical protein E3U43_018872, partial [Larimichthys crocea]
VLDVPSNDTKKNDTNSINSENKPDILMYVYLAAGILAFVIIVIVISVASLHGCKGKSKKKETQTDNEYMAIPMVEHPFQHDSLQASPRGSPSEPPVSEIYPEKDTHAFTLAAKRLADTKGQ